MAIEQIIGSNCDAQGCPKLDSRELLDISEATTCENYWFYENSFSERRLSERDAFELRDITPRGQVSPTMFAIPCRPGEPLDVTRGGTMATVDFANYRTWVGVDPCEVLEEVYLPDDCDVYDRLPYEEKYRRHVALKTSLLRESVMTRYELMSTMMKLYGSYIVEGPKMDPVMYDFQRKPCLTAAAKSNWCEINSFPLQDFKYYCYLVKLATGKVARRIHMGVDAWHAFYSHHQVQKHVVLACNCTEPGNNLNVTGEDDCGVEFMGMIDNKPIYVDSRTFTDYDGTQQFYVPADAMLIETDGMGGLRGHGRIMSPSANFEPGDLFFRQIFDEDSEFWKLEVMGSILIMARQVNSCMMIRNLSKVMTYPGDTCRDVLINEEGQVWAPPLHGSEDENRIDEIAAEVAGSDYFEVCSMVVGRTPPRVACSDLEECVPGEPCRIVPTDNPCPDALQRVISKDNLLTQGVDENAMCDLVRHYALRPIAQPDPEQLQAPLFIDPSQAVSKAA